MPRNGGWIELGDAKELSHFNGKKNVSININKTKEGNAIALSREIRAMIKEFAKDNYLGGIMRFDINVELFGIIPGQQDGSVICSDRSLTGWTFTTIESPVDWNHPVSGNREFGLVANPDQRYLFS